MIFNYNFINDKYSKLLDNKSIFEEKIKNVLIEDFEYLNSYFKFEVHVYDTFDKEDTFTKANVRNENDTIIIEILISEILFWFYDRENLKQQFNESVNFEDFDYDYEYERLEFNANHIIYHELSHVDNLIRHPFLKKSMDHFYLKRDNFNMCCMNLINEYFAHVSSFKKFCPDQNSITVGFQIIPYDRYSLEILHKYAYRYIQIIAFNKVSGIELNIDNIIETSLYKNLIKAFTKFELSESNMKDRKLLSDVRMSLSEYTNIKEFNRKL